jgi:undecaprenyl-diphosphatase
MIRASLLSRLDASDRALFLRWVLRAATPRPSLRRWRALTHVGGLRASIAAILIPAAIGGPTMQVASLQAAITLILSHLVVQVVKRSVVRERPQLAVAAGNHVVVPDRFSFPSGHSCAVMSVAIVYAIAVPDLAWPLLALSLLVGFSRVRLGVHYPGDVLAGQLIALVAGAAVVGLW